MFTFDVYISVENGYRGVNSAALGMFKLYPTGSLMYKNTGLIYKKPGKKEFLFYDTEYSSWTVGPNPDWSEAFWIVNSNATTPFKITETWEVAVGRFAEDLPDGDDDPTGFRKIQNVKITPCDLRCAYKWDII